MMDAGVDGGCPDVEQQLFKPSCGGVGCHEDPGAANNLDLVSPGVAARIRATTSTCQAKPMATFILEKVKPMPGCGLVMPLGALDTELLNAFELSCLQDYLAKVVDGGI